MASRPLSENARPVKPDIDADGVDRAQIRAMLALSPEERLRRVEEFVESALEIRELNGPANGLTYTKSDDLVRIRPLDRR